MKLSEMKVGECGRITSVLGEGLVVQRLFEMGLIQGSKIKVMRFAPLGDPMSINIKGYQLSLRKSEASLVDIQPG